MSDAVIERALERIRQDEQERAALKAENDTASDLLERIWKAWAKGELRDVRVDDALMSSVVVYLNARRR